MSNPQDTHAGRYLGYRQQRVQQCDAPEACRAMMFGVAAEVNGPCEDRMRALIESHIAATQADLAGVRRDMEAMADRAADRAADDVMKRFCKLVFDAEEPSSEQVTGLHRMQALGKWSERGMHWLLIAVVGLLAASFVADRLDVLASAVRDRAHLERPVVGQVPHQ